MPRRRPSFPSYRLHKPSGQAVVRVRLSGGGKRDIYLGVYDTPASRAEYNRVIAELAAGRPPGACGPNLPVVPHWHPNRLRHLRGTEVRRAYGLEAAQVLLGHARADVTQVYAERDEALAARVAAETG